MEQKPVVAVSADIYIEMKMPFLFSIGKIEPDDGSYLVVEEETNDMYTRFLFHDSHLVGAILYGNTLISPQIKKAIENRQDFSGLLQRQPSVKDTWDFIITHC